MERQALHSACKELRLRLGLDQARMAAKLGKHVNTVQRFEGLGLPPSGESLAAYVTLSAKNGHHDLASLFKAELEKEVTPEFVDALNYTGQPATTEPTRLRVANAVMIQSPKRLAPILQMFRDMLENPADETERALGEYIRITMERKISERDLRENGRQKEA